MIRLAERGYLSIEGSVNQSTKAHSFRKRMMKKSEAEYLRQLGGWFLNVLYPVPATDTWS